MHNLYLVQTGNKLPLKEFSRNVISQLLEQYGTLTAKRHGRQSTSNFDKLLAVNYMERHAPAHVPQ